STISFRVTNFVLVAPGGPGGVSNEGHVRVRLDNAYYADLTDDAPLHLNLKDGPHNVTLQLVDNEGAPLNPDVTVSLHITVQALGNATPWIVSFAVANFGLVQPGRVGQVASPTEGHVDLYVDDVYSRLLTRVEPLSLLLESGPHTIRLQLVQDNGTPLSPNVSASVRVVATHGPAVGTPTITIVSPKPGPTISHDLYFALEVTNFT